jgi:hypothetical protein
MSGVKENCAFLDSAGRCSIHSIRPGICRIFPLGRIYDNGGFQYFLQVHECRKSNRTKVKVKKWIDTPEIAKNEVFVSRWHYFLKDISRMLSALPEDKVREINMYLLNVFFVTLYEGNRDFYEQFEERMSGAEETLKPYI